MDSLPIDSAFASMCDNGNIELCENDLLSNLVAEIEKIVK